MNWRAAGCLVTGAAAFVAMGVFALSLAVSPDGGCPASLVWSERTYGPIGSPAPSPAFDAAGDPVELGPAVIGLTTLQVWGPPGSAPSASAETPPDEIALDCADGTFQSYRYSGELPARPSPSAR